MRELIGFFDEMAALDATGERFVFTSTAYIIETAEKNCKRFNGKPYSESSIRHGLAEARARRVISKLLERERWLPSGEKGHQMLRALGGSIVANHDCVTHFENGECTWVGPMHGCGRWQRTGNGGPGTVLYWNGCGLHSPATGGLPNGKQLLSAPNTAPSAEGVQGTVHTTVQSTVQTVCIPCAEPMAQADSGQPSDLPEVNPKNGGQAVVTVMPVQTVSPAQPEQPSYPVEPAPPAKPAAAQESKPGGLTTSPSGACAPFGHDVTKPLGSEVTIGQQFTIKDDMQLLTEISDGEFNAHAYKQTGDIDLLCEYVRMVVEEIAGLPWDNQRATCADIMDVVAKRMQRAGVRYPEGWFKVLKLLQKGGACKAVEPYRPPRNPNWVGYQNHDGPPNANDVKAHNHFDFQMCDDWIKRDEAGRAAEGFTAKNSVGAWTKA
jgi:hypothetical protein